MQADKERPLRVLISNDDGPPNEEESPFIEPFIEHLERLGWVVRVALPNCQKSWVSKSFMIKDHVDISYYNRKSRQINLHQHDPSDFVLLSGTPATCVNIALHHVFKNEEFDLVIAGPNFGRNSSTIYTLSSGTIGAAMEGVMCSQKAIALSFAFFSRDFSKDKIQNTCLMASQVIRHLWSLNKWPSNGLFNINVPLVDHPCPVHLTTFNQANYGSLFQPVRNRSYASDSANTIEQQVRMETEGESGRTTFEFAPDIKAMSNPINFQPGTDAWALHKRYISVTPMVAAYEVSKSDTDYEFETLNNKL
ncbi:hypothetical protein DFQ30_001519 [Apophysomyces sp. BC1015]|nr:hypothetical protein DFQ30_001519 [Apophysomyces sp. BC1015]